jgi:hypothetical protein
MLKFAKKPSDLFGKPDRSFFYPLDPLKTQYIIPDRQIARSILWLVSTFRQRSDIPSVRGDAASPYRSLPENDHHHAQVGQALARNPVPMLAPMEK